MSQPERNRRWNARADVALPAAWREIGGGIHFGTVENLSASGLRVRSVDPMTPSTQVYVVVGHESLSLSFETRAEVVRSEPLGNGYLIALTFRSLRPEHAAQIARYIFRRPEQGETPSRDAESA